jgi:hypothetical protein
MDSSSRLASSPPGPKDPETPGRECVFAPKPDPHGLRCATHQCPGKALTEPYMFLLCYYCLRAIHDLEVKKQRLTGDAPCDAIWASSCHSEPPAHE